MTGGQRGWETFKRLALRKLQLAKLSAGCTRDIQPCCTPTLSRMSQGRKGAPVVAGKPRYEAWRGGRRGWCVKGWMTMWPTQQPVQPKPSASLHWPK